jgi:hypothetical protein
MISGLHSGRSKHINRPRESPAITRDASLPIITRHVRGSSPANWLSSRSERRWHSRSVRSADHDTARAVGQHHGAVDWARCPSSAWLVPLAMSQSYRVLSLDQEMARASSGNSTAPETGPVCPSPRRAPAEQDRQVHRRPRSPAARPELHFCGESRPSRAIVPGPTSSRCSAARLSRTSQPRQARCSASRSRTSASIQASG